MRGACRLLSQQWSSAWSPAQCLCRTTVRNCGSRGGLSSSHVRSFCPTSAATTQNNLPEVYDFLLAEYAVGNKRMYGMRCMFVYLPVRSRWSISLPSIPCAKHNGDATFVFVFQHVQLLSFHAMFLTKNSLHKNTLSSALKIYLSL